MDTVQDISVTSKIDNCHPTDTMNNEISSTSSEDIPNNTRNKINFSFNSRQINGAVSDNEVLDVPKRPPRMHARSHYKSMGNITDNDHNRDLNMVQNRISNIDIYLHKSEVKKFEVLKIPIVGYEVMEERARFTIYKLKVEDDKRDQSWLVFRRYTDFVRLYTRIKSEQPNLILPLPGKRLWFRDNFEPAFLEERVKGLQIFVNGILDKIPNHPLVREFFCMDEPPTVLSYQPEVQAVYEALEDSIGSLKMQLRQKDATIMHLQKRVAQLEAQSKDCTNCSTNI